MLEMQPGYKTILSASSAPAKRKQRAVSTTGSASLGGSTKGERTRWGILNAAAALASTEGLTSLSIGGLADVIGMSKSGLFAHFGSKEELQIATVEHAGAVFREEVVLPAEVATAGIARLWSLCDHWLSYSEREVFPGGCFFAATSVEFENKPGAVRNLIVRRMRQWISVLERAALEAQNAAELPPGLDCAQLAFEINSLATGANVAYQLFRDKKSFDRARFAIGERLALSTCSASVPLRPLPERSP